MEMKKVVYSGQDTADVTMQMEREEEKMAAKGWTARRVDMLSSATVRVTYVRGPEDDEDDDIEGGSEGVDIE